MAARHRFMLNSAATMPQPDSSPPPLHPLLTCDIAAARHPSPCLMQPRKRQKHVAEYVADRPLCGSWAELDGEFTASLRDSHLVQVEKPDLCPPSGLNCIAGPPPARVCLGVWCQVAAEVHRTHLCAGSNGMALKRYDLNTCSSCGVCGPWL